MTTLFLIQVNTATQAMTYGPYLSFKEASTVFTEHLDSILCATGLESTSYTAELIEAIPAYKTWEIIEIKISSTEFSRMDAE